MKNEIAEVYLHTPLLSLSSDQSSAAKRPLPEEVYKIKGEILDDTDGGVLISIKELSSLRGNRQPSPFSKIFIPYHKIDHIRFVE